MRLKIFLLIIALIVLHTDLCAAEDGLWAPHPAFTLAGIGKLVLPQMRWRPQWIIEVAGDPPIKGYDQENFVLRLYRSDSQTEKPIEKHFNTSYGGFELNIFDLTRDFVEEFILITGEGRGSGVRSETLEVLAVRDDAFKSLLKVNTSAHCGGACYWWYTHSFNLRGSGYIPKLQVTYRQGPQGGPYVLRLTRHYDFPFPEAGDFGAIPKESIKDYEYDNATDTMKLINWHVSSESPPNPGVHPPGAKPKAAPDR